MVSRGVVKIEPAWGGIGAPMEVTQIRLGQKDGHLAAENSKINSGGTVSGFSDVAGVKE